MEKLGVDKDNLSYYDNKPTCSYSRLLLVGILSLKYSNNLG